MQGTYRLATRPVFKSLTSVRRHGTTTAMREISRSTAVAANVRAELARRHLTQRNLAERLEKSPNYVSRRMTGDVAWDIDELFAIADWLGVSASALLSPASAA